MNAAAYRSRIWYPILAVGLSMVAFITIKTGRDAVFFQNRGIFELPLAYVYIAIASLPAAMIHLGAIARWGARKTRTGLFVFAALILAPFTFILPGGNNALLLAYFVIVPTIFAAVFAGAWLLAGDLLEESTDEIKRWAYSRIGAASMIGGILGGLFAKALLVFVAPQLLVLVGSAILPGVAVVVAVGHLRYPVLADTCSHCSSTGISLVSLISAPSWVSADWRPLPLCTSISSSMLPLP